MLNNKNNSVFINIPTTTNFSDNDTTAGLYMRVGRERFITTFDMKCETIFLSPSNLEGIPDINSSNI